MSKQLKEFFQYFDIRVRKGFSSSLTGSELIILEMYDDFLKKKKYLKRFTL